MLNLPGIALVIRTKESAAIATNVRRLIFYSNSRAENSSEKRRMTTLGYAAAETFQSQPVASKFGRFSGFNPVIFGWLSY